MQLVSDEPEFEELLSKLESIACEVGSNSSLEVYRGSVGPPPRLDSLPVQDKGYHGVLFKDPTSDHYLIQVKVTGDWEVMSDVAGLNPHYITFRRDNQLVAVLDHRPCLDRLYVNEILRQAREKGEKILGDDKDVEVVPPVLYLIDSSFPHKRLEEAIKDVFGCGLTIYYNPNYQFPKTIDTPPMALDKNPKKFDEKWESGKGWETLKVPATIYERPIHVSQK